MAREPRPQAAHLPVARQIVQRVEHLTARRPVGCRRTVRCASAVRGSVRAVSAARGAWVERRGETLACFQRLQAVGHTEATPGARWSPPVTARERGEVHHAPAQGHDGPVLADNVLLRHGRPSLQLECATYDGPGCALAIRRTSAMRVGTQPAGCRHRLTRKTAIIAFSMIRLAACVQRAAREEGVHCLHRHLSMRGASPVTNRQPFG